MNNVANDKYTPSENTSLPPTAKQRHVKEILNDLRIGLDMAIKNKLVDLKFYETLIQCEQFANNIDNF